MSCLSVIEDRSKMIATVVANPIFLTSPIEGLQNGSKIVFEIFEIDAGGLIVSETKYYTIDGRQPFWGKVKLLEPCESTHPGLALLRDKPTLRCVLEIFPQETSGH
jgi:hypothetical protein